MNRVDARKKAEELVMKMTIEERASQLRYDAPAIERLNIPAYNWWNEALHGVARAGQATVFPQAIGLGATFDTDLIHNIGEVIAEEGRAKYNAQAAHNDRDIYKGLTFWAPNVNIFRDPRWGRGHETYGEDPYLTSRLGVSFVEGLQGDEENMKAAACAKHFAVHSGPEALRHEFDVSVSDKDKFETYMPAFEALVKEAKVEAVMGAYNRVDGEPACGSKTLITDLLRDTWGFEGHFTSDCWAIRDFHENHMVTATPRESAALALNAGCDLNCGVTYLHLLGALEDGLVTEEAITEAAIRLYTTRYMLGLFDGSVYDNISYDVVECDEHLALSEEAAAESFVLLKNNGILPLNKDNIKTVGVVGPNANSRAALIGNYHGTASEYITVLDGIRRYIRDNDSDIRVLSSEGCHLFEDKTENLAVEYDRLAEAATVAEYSDVVVLVVGLDEGLEGEEGDTGNSYASGDKTSLFLPEPQLKLMETIRKTGKPTVLCMMAGSDIDLSFASEHFDAVIQLWYPGAQGGLAAAKVLFGETAPSGKLPLTFYEDLDVLPEFTDYVMKGRTYRYIETKAQYPFGYGLTYGKADIASANISLYADELSKEINYENLAETAASACVELKNDSDRDVTEVLQVYVKRNDSEFDTLNPSLVGFARVSVPAGNTVTTAVQIPRRAFCVINEAGQCVDAGKNFTFYVGFSQPDARSVELMGCAPVEIAVNVEA